MAKSHIHKCALCRNEEELTFEHIPPRAAFNSSAVKPVTGDKLIGDDRMPWDMAGLKYTNQQCGMGKYSLCRKCNNNTGSWYAQDYIDIAYIIDQCFKNGMLKVYNAIVIKEVHPLRFIKQIISMFCSINNFEDKRLDALREFVLNKNAKGLDRSKYRICYYFTESLLIKYAPFSVLLKTDDISFNSIVLSEITAYPLGFILYFDPDDSINYDGIDITSFSDFNYDDLATVILPFCIKEMNDLFPAHFRSKEEIIECVEKNKKYIKDNIDEQS